MNDEVLKTPQSYESEQSVLGGLLQDYQAFDLISDTLQVSDFYRREHQVIFEKIKTMIQAGKPVDMITVYTDLQTDGMAEAVGGLPYLNSLVNAVPSAVNIKRYAETIKDRSILRQLLMVAGSISEMVKGTEVTDVSHMVDTAQDLILKVGERYGRKDEQSLQVGSTLAKITAELEELSRSDAGWNLSGLPSGFIQLDRMTSGFHEGDLIIVAGRPAMGKTSFAMNIAEFVGVHLRKPVLVFSMEMSIEQLVKRMLSGTGRINAQRMKNGSLDGNDWARYVDAVELLEQCGIYIDDTAGLTIAELRGRVQRFCRKHGVPAMIVVDYIQLMSGGLASKQASRVLEISEISRGLKVLAKDLGIPIIALSQLSRAVDSRPDKRPVMSDLRESGSIEQDADMVFFVYRDWVYHKDTGNPNESELVIAKQRSGPTGIIKMSFNGGYTKFDNACFDIPLLH